VHKILKLARLPGRLPNPPETTQARFHDRASSGLRFRTKSFTRSETVATVASLDIVISVFGGGGLKGTAGVEAVFGGSAYFQNNDTGAAYLGVWGSRNGGRFRIRICEAGMSVAIVHESPPARLRGFIKLGKRPDRTAVQN
jgi:hypothetical protein